MLSYKDYKLYNESFLAAGPTPLGLRTPNSLGVMGSHPELEEDEALEEAKKKKGKKKMLADVEPEPEPEEEDEEDIDVEEKPDVDVEEPEEEEPEEEEDEGEEDIKIKLKKKLGNGDEDEDLEPKFKKKCSGKNCGKGMKKESTLTDEEKGWWTSVNRMVNADPNERFWDGIGPKPGEPGFAPQTRIGEEPAAEPADVPQGEETDSPKGEEATEEQRARTGWSANYPPAYFSAQYPKFWMNPRKATTDLDAQIMGRKK